MRLSTSGQAGNVLFLILIAVALFGALVYAVTATTRSGSNASSEADKAQMVATQFTQYGAAVSSTIMRMILSNGCTATTLSFQTPSWAHPTLWGGSTNSLAPADGSCHVFGHQGTPFMSRLSGASWSMMVTSQASVQNIGTSSSELVLFYVMDGSSLADKICDAFNRGQGNAGSASGGTIRTPDWGFPRGAGIPYTTTPSPVQTIGEDGGAALQGGKPAGCIDGGTSHHGDDRILYQVLLER